MEVDHYHRVISIFGGKLTDCLSVGREITEQVLVLCARAPVVRRGWFGESGPEVRNTFLQRARGVFGHEDSESAIAERLWRYYGDRAGKILDAIESDTFLGEIVLQNFGITRGELEFVRMTQMVVTLDDYLRRRTLLAQTIRKEELARLLGMTEVCQILFGDNAREYFQGYFGDLGTAISRY